MQCNLHTQTFDWFSKVKKIKLREKQRTKAKTLCAGLLAEHSDSVSWHSLTKSGPKSASMYTELTNCK